MLVFVYIQFQFNYVAAILDSAFKTFVHHLKKNYISQECKTLWFTRYMCTGLHTSEY